MIPNFLNYLNIVLAICLAVGGFFAFRKGQSRESATIQQQTIDALKIRMETLEGQIASDEKEIARLRQIISTIRHALKRRGLHIEIEGDVVTLTDVNAQSATSTKMPPIAKVVRPVKLQPMPDDDDTTA